MIHFPFYYIFYLFSCISIPIFSFIYISFLHKKIKYSFDPYNYTYHFDYISYYDKNIHLPSCSNFALSKLHSNFVIDLTPKGYVIMKYDFDYNLFSYYTNNSSIIHYNYLNCIASTYCKFFNCCDFFYDDYVSETETETETDNDIKTENKKQNKKQNETKTETEDKEEYDFVFYKKPKKNVNNDIISNDTSCNRFKYLGNIQLFFSSISDNEFICLSTFDTSVNKFIYYTDNYCKYINSILYDNSNNLLIDFYNNNITDIYQESNYNNYLAYKFETSFFQLNKNESPDSDNYNQISWLEYKKNL